MDPQGSTSGSSSSALQRGKACISCRRRKMKCDGVRPICTPCLRGDRAEDCEYTDGQHRARTLALEEDVARLRARVQELENPEATVPSVELHAPYADAGPSATSSASYHHGGAVGQTPTPKSPAGSVPDPLHLNPEVGVPSGHALSVVAPYATELGLFLDIDRLRGHGTYILPALRSTLTLWSIHITSVTDPDRGQASERSRVQSAHILLQVQTQFATALSTVNAEPNPVVLLHLVQTGVLLAYYMQRIGQVLGGRYYASGAWGMAVMLKLHECPSLAVDVAGDDGEHFPCGPTHYQSASYSSAFAGSTKLTPALDQIEAEERVRAFWAVYALDQYFTAVGQGFSQSLATSGCAITVPWPDDENLSRESNVIQDILDDPGHDFTQDGPSAIDAKAAVFLGEAKMLAASFAAGNTIGQSTASQARFAKLDTLLRRCLDAAMMMATKCQPHTPQHRQVLVTIHVIALAHVTHHRPFIQTYSLSARRCEEAMLAVVNALDRMHELGFSVGCVSPLYGIVWTALCLAMHDVILGLRAQPAADPSGRRQSDAVGAIQKLVNRLSASSQRSSDEFFAIKIEALLPVLESIAIQPYATV